MRVLVAGAAGMVGRSLVAALGSDAIAAPRKDLDITDAKAIRMMVAQHAPDAIVNAAAYTDVDGAESDRDAAFAVNAHGAQNLAVSAAEAGASFIHISTDFVFDGRLGRAYQEDDAPTPICVYAASKAEGERLVREVNPDAAIARTAWVYGAGHRTFLSQILDRARSGEHLRVVTDQHGSPTWTQDLTGGLMQLLRRPVAGMFHVAGAGVASRYEFACAILREAGLDDSLVEPVTTDQFPLRPAARPTYAPLEAGAWRDAGFTPLRHWSDALAEAIKELS